MTDHDLVEVQSTAVVPAENEADRTFALLKSAVDAGQSPETLERILDLQQRVMEQQARQAYNVALAEFQASVGAIHKRKEVRDRNGRLMYKFAPLDDIVAQIKPLLGGLGLTFTFDSDQGDRGIDVWCTIRHKDGHAEKSHVFVPFTQGHNTNAAQNRGIELQYGKRYSLIGALGIVTADEDPEGASQKLKPINVDQVAEIEDLIVQAQADKPYFLKYMNVESVADIAERDYDRALSALNAKISRQQS